VLPFDETMLLGDGTQQADSETEASASSEQIEIEQVEVQQETPDQAQVSCVI